MSNHGDLADEIQRKSAEIDRWPTWAKPYDAPPPAPDPAGQPAD
jgi:hypothetical protein